MHSPFDVTVTVCLNRGYSLRKQMRANESKCKQMKANANACFKKYQVNAEQMTSQSHRQMMGQSFVSEYPLGLNEIYLKIWKQICFFLRIINSRTALTNLIENRTE